MPIHESNPDRRPDSDFIPGELALLVPGNRCRLLDGRRTPGVIESCDHKSAVFVWRIKDFEDEGKAWTLPAEDVKRFQFEKGSGRLPAEEAQSLRDRVEGFQKPLEIRADPEIRKVTERAIIYLKGGAKSWLKINSRFFREGRRLDFGSREGSASLAEDLLRYMAEHELKDLEQRTAENIVLNPFSGELVKGMLITLAEMGLVDYHGKIPRIQGTFEGQTSQTHRKKYLIHRLAFVRAYFELLDIHEVVLYRGMSTEGEWRQRGRSFLSCTFSQKVAGAFADFDRESRFRQAYLVKTTVPVDRLWMTYLETAAMNRQYLEAEALVLYRGDLKIHW
jgi:hypothetical protein